MSRRRWPGPGPGRVGTAPDRAPDVPDRAPHTADRAPHTADRAPRTPDRAPDTPSDRGSMSVELVVIAPALVLLLLLLGAGGRWVESHGALDGAARDAARAASLGRTAGDADTLANQAADADLASSGWCDGGTVSVGVSGFPATATVAEGTVVTVTVNCSVNMSPFTELGFKAATPVTSTAVAPLDPFMCRGADCQ